MYSRKSLSVLQSLPLCVSINVKKFCAVQICIQYMLKCAVVVKIVCARKNLSQVIFTLLPSATIECSHS